MTSLLTQIRPAPSEAVDRRQGVRKYQPDFPLSRYVNIPWEQEKLDPKISPVWVRPLGGGVPPPGYATTYGHLDQDLKDQFARHFQWKTASQRDYLRHYPPFPPVPVPGFEPRADMVRFTWPGRREAGGPFDYQRVVRRGYELPENKAWPMMGKDYRNFPNNIDGPAPRFRTLKHNIGGRTPEDTAKVREDIRRLVKENNLNPQFVKPMPHFRGLQREVRVYEEPERTLSRNPPNTHSEYIAQYNRHIPSKEYRRPQFALEHLISKTVVLTDPCNHFNHAEHPPLLDYLPMPYNLTSTPHDVRLI